MFRKSLEIVSGLVDWNRGHWIIRESLESMNVPVFRVVVWKREVGEQCWRNLWWMKD